MHWLLGNGSLSSFPGYCQFKIAESQLGPGKDAFGLSNFNNQNGNPASTVSELARTMNCDDVNGVTRLSLNSSPTAPW